MAIVKDYWVRCDNDNCGHSNHADTSAAKARREAKKYGWTRVRMNGKLVDLCPRCSKQKREVGNG